MRVATIIVAALALWWALRGVSRTLRAGVRPTVRGVVYLLLSGSALALAVWLHTAEPADVGAAAVEVGAALGLDALWEWITEAISDALEGLVPFG